MNQQQRKRREQEQKEAALRAANSETSLDDLSTLGMVVDRSANPARRGGRRANGSRAVEEDTGLAGLGFDPAPPVPPRTEKLAEKPSSPLSRARGSLSPPPASNVKLRGTRRPSWQAAAQASGQRRRRSLGR